MIPPARKRGRPRGSGHLGTHMRLTFRIPAPLYEQLCAFAEGRTYARGAPELAKTLREALEHFLTCPHKRQTEKPIWKNLDVEVMEAPEERELAFLRQTENYDHPHPEDNWQTEKLEIQTILNNRQTEKRSREITTNNGPYDPTRFGLGKLCKAGHDYQDTGQSVRQLKGDSTIDGECRDCKRARSQAYRQRKKQL